MAIAGTLYLAVVPFRDSQKSWKFKIARVWLRHGVHRRFSISFAAMHDSPCTVD